MELTVDPGAPGEPCRSSHFFIGNDYTALVFRDSVLFACWGDNSRWSDDSRGCFGNQGWDVLLRKVATEICDNSVDDDGDGYTDCDDLDCCDHDDCPSCAE